MVRPGVAAVIAAARHVVIRQLFIVVIQDILIDRGRIRHLYVSEKCRGLGIGKQLLTVVMADASIWFDFLNTHAPDAAYGFYRQAGFTLVSDEPRVTHRLFCAV